MNDENNRFELKSFDFYELKGRIYDNLKQEELHLSLYGFVDLLNDVAEEHYSLILLKEDIIKALDNAIKKNGEEEYD